METGSNLAATAQLFKVLGNESRLRLVLAVSDEPCTVGALAAATGLSQPLVSQHLRSLREAHLVTATRAGKEVIYRLADQHVAHVIADSLAHATESAPASTDP